MTQPTPPNLGYLLTQAAHAWRVELAEMLKPFEVTSPQFFALASLYRLTVKSDKYPSQRDIATSIAMDINTASQVIRGLEQKGLILRQASPRDSRAIALSLSPAGLALAEQTTKLSLALNARFFAGVSPGLAIELRQLMQRAN